jgi:hypothetical protein
VTHANADDYAPIMDAAVETVAAGEKMVVESTPDSGETAEIDCIGASKYAGLTYEVRADNRVRYPEVGVPPTDVDDLSRTFIPALEFRNSLKIIVRNPSSTERTVAVQIRGWEPA